MDWWEEPLPAHRLRIRKQTTVIFLRKQTSVIFL